MGQTLTPSAATPIKQGDVLKLGRVEICVYDVIVEPEYKENQTEMVFEYENQTMFTPNSVHELPVGYSVEIPAPMPACTPPVPVSPPAPIPVQTPPTHTSKVKKFCTGCGKENMAMKSFCANCGKTLQV
jgi:hypothetical protein